MTMRRPIFTQSMAGKKLLLILNIEQEACRLNYDF